MDNGRIDPQWIRNRIERSSGILDYFRAIRDIERYITNPDTKPEQPATTKHRAYRRLWAFIRKHRAR